MSSLLINPARLSFCVPHALGGLVMAGHKGEERQSGNGDCILIDGSCGLVALADGAERSPNASRDFLVQLAGQLCQSEPKAWPDRQGWLLDAVHQVLDGFAYEERTTFICLLAGEEGAGFYVSGGDSLLFLLDPSAARIRFSNRSNMGFAGRSKRVMDSGKISAGQGDLFLLASDGLWDLLSGRRRDLIRFVFEELQAGPFHTFPERLVRAKHPSFRGALDQPYDDLSILLVSPGGLARVRSRMLVGGTGKGMEMHYRKQRSRGALPDRQLRLPGRDSSLWVFPDELQLLEKP